MLSFEKLGSMLVVFTISLTAMSSLADWDVANSNKVADCIAMLSTQSIEQISNYIEDGEDSLWRLKLAVEELAKRDSVLSLNLLQNFQSQFSREPPLSRKRRLIAKIAVEIIRCEHTNKKDRIIALAKMLDSQDLEFVNESAIELVEIGTNDAREVLLLREKEGSNTAKRHRLRLDVKNLSINEAIDYLFKSIYGFAVLLVIAAIKKMVAERSCVQEVISRDIRGFLKHVEKCQQEFGEKMYNQSEGDVLYAKLLQEYVDQAKQLIKNEEAYWARKNKRQKHSEKTQKSSQSSNKRRNTIKKPLYTDEEIARMQAEMRERRKKEDWKAKDKKELLETLNGSEDKIRLRKAAKELGDRVLAGAEELTDAEKLEVTVVVKNCLQLAKSKDGNDRESARMQAEGLWALSVPELLNNVASEDLSVMEFSHKTLSLMRNEEIIQSLMKMAMDSSDGRRRTMAIIELGYMTEKRDSIVPGRQQNDSDELKALVQQKVRPLLVKFSESDKDAEVRKVATFALKNLDASKDRRPVRVNK